MKRVVALAIAVVALSACATVGGGGGGAVSTDCYADYCVEYADEGQRLYLRTPGTPASGRRGDVTAAAPRGGTQVVTRDPAAASVSPRMSPVPAVRPASPSVSGGRRP
jgi:hypothetical protein